MKVEKDHGKMFKSDLDSNEKVAFDSDTPLNVRTQLKTLVSLGVHNHFDVNLRARFNRNRTIGFNLNLDRKKLQQEKKPLGRS
jgi:urease beta subunit